MGARLSDAGLREIHRLAMEIGMTKACRRLGRSESGVRARFVRAGLPLVGREMIWRRKERARATVGQDVGHLAAMPRRRYQDDPWAAQWERIVARLLGDGLGREDAETRATTECQRRIT